MGHVHLDESGSLVVTLENHEDAAAFRTALRCASDPDPVVVPSGAGTVTMDANHAEHILIAWACQFRWFPEALARAIDELAPYARQSVAMHASSSLKSQKRWLGKMNAAHSARQQPG
jgi:hypothetical protein